MIEAKPPAKEEQPSQSGVHRSDCLSLARRVGDDQLDFGYQDACTCGLRDNPPLANVPLDRRRDVLACFEIALELA